MSKYSNIVKVRVSDDELRLLNVVQDLSHFDSVSDAIRYLIAYWDAAQHTPIATTASQPIAPDQPDESVSDETIQPDDFDWGC